MAALSFCLLTSLLFRWLLVIPAQFHLTENTLALQLFLQRTQGLIDIIVADRNGNYGSYSIGCLYKVPDYNRKPAHNKLDCQPGSICS